MSAEYSVEEIHKAAVEDYVSERVLKMLRSYAKRLKADEGAAPVANTEIVITKDANGYIVAVTEQNKEFRITKLLAASPSFQCEFCTGKHPVTAEPVAQGEAARLIEMCGDVWQEMNAYTDRFDKGSKAVPYVEVAATDLVNWCQVIAMASRGLHERITNENLASIQHNRLLAKYEQALAAQPRAVPDGWVLVPPVASAAMESAFGAEYVQRNAKCDLIAFRDSYSAMLAAAPSPGESA